MFIRPDWTLFRHLDGLGQQAGVPRDRIPWVVAKELVDNALDEVGACETEVGGPGSFSVIDAGPGLPGGQDPEAVARLFSIDRPLTSSKLLRKPRRGALGNGLRVVAGAVLSTGGTLTVTTHGRRLELVPQDDGTTRVGQVAKAPGEKGTRIDVHLGGEFAAVDPNRELWLCWAKQALDLAGGSRYERASSPHWYDASAFFELLNAAGDTPVRKLIEQLDGCSGARAGEIAAPFKSLRAADLSREQAAQLLRRAQAGTRVVTPSKLGRVGEVSGYGSHAYLATTVHLGPKGSPGLDIPCAVEAWVKGWGALSKSPLVAGRSIAFATVNRTPAVADLQVSHTKGDLALFGCGLSHCFKVGHEPVIVRLNLDAPFVPIVSNGKLPDLAPFLEPLATVLERAARAARRGARSAGSGATTLRSVVFDSIAEAAEKVSGGGHHRFSLRQLFYGLRPYALAANLGEPNYSSFSAIVGDYERAQGHDLKGMYRDNRGSLYHPHLGHEIPLGTLAVESYERPAWTFNKILFVEKEGFNQALRDTRWPERNDCALVSSKGFPSRALRDLLDLMGEGEEPIDCFAIHDADAAGTCIYEALINETAARKARKVVVHNLGLEPAEALEMELLPEPVEAKAAHTRPVADYVEPKWREWLQTHRVELNAMTTPAFIAWLDRKMAAFHLDKVIPPAPVMTHLLEEATRRTVREDITRNLLTEGRLDERVQAALDSNLLDERAAVLEEEVRADLSEHPEEPWRDPVQRLGLELGHRMVKQAMLPSRRSDE